mgnify:CR=1 FL=1
MTTANANQKVLDLLTGMSTRLERIEIEVKEIKGEIGLEVRPEYVEKLKRIESQKGRTFDSKDKLLSYLKNEV